MIKCNLSFTALPQDCTLPFGKDKHCRSKTDTERQHLGHIVEKRIKNFGTALSFGRAALILNFKGVFMCNEKGSHNQPD